MKNRLFLLGQYLLPHHALSRLTGYFAKCRVPWFKNQVIRCFIRWFDVDMRAAIGDGPEDYEHFDAFFTRPLKSGARPLQGGNGSVISPADGVISQIGVIDGDRLFQAKGHTYTLGQLLGGNAALAGLFQDGRFVTIYLSPGDYHRVHMPLTGTLRTMIHVPGKLFSVNPLTVSKVPNLFARNERVICVFDTHAGPMAVVLVGAMIVASITTVWAGSIQSSGSDVTTVHYQTGKNALKLARGVELGRFGLGSTVIVVFGARAIDWIASTVESQPLRVGQQLGLVVSG